jgi:hypothetical protein
VNPAIAEVILIQESLEAAQLQVAEWHASGIDADHAAIVVDSVFSAPNLETVQMLIIPTEGDLQCLMELSDRAIAAHQKPPPYQRTDAAQNHAKLVDLRFMKIIFRHGVSLHLCAAHPPLSVTLL